MARIPDENSRKGVGSLKKRKAASTFYFRDLTPDIWGADEAAPVAAALPSAGPCKADDCVFR